MAEATLDLEQDIEEERLFNLHAARQEKKYELSLSKRRVLDYAKRLAIKLNEEIARGHDTVAFTIALSLALFLDAYIFFGSIVVMKITGALTTLFAALSAPAALTIILSPVSVLGASLGPSIGAGLYIGHKLVGIFLNGFLIYFLWNKGFLLKRKVRIVVWVFGFFFDFIPVLGELVFNSLVVLFAWHHVKKRAHAAENKLANLSKLSRDEAEELEKNIELLDKED